MSMGVSSPQEMATNRQSYMATTSMNTSWSRRVKYELTSSLPSINPWFLICRYPKHARPATERILQHPERCCEILLTAGEFKVNLAWPNSDSNSTYIYIGSPKVLTKPYFLQFLERHIFHEFSFLSHFASLFLSDVSAWYRVFNHTLLMRSLLKSIQGLSKSSKSTGESCHFRKWASKTLKN